MKEKIIQILINYQHSMAGHSWLIGLDINDFVSITDEILTLPLYPKEFVEWIVDQFKKGIMFHNDSDNTFSFYNQDCNY
jgi:hypothetical protein